MLGPMWPTVGRMYTPKHFDLPDLSHARLMIQEHPLATLMLIDPTHGLSATPVPMIWGAPSEASTGEGWWLEGHLARANPHVAALMSGEITSALQAPYHETQANLPILPAANIFQAEVP